MSSHNENSNLFNVISSCDIFEGKIEKERRLYFDVSPAFMFLSITHHISNYNLNIDTNCFWDLHLLFFQTFYIDFNIVITSITNRLNILINWQHSMSVKRKISWWSFMVDSQLDCLPSLHEVEHWMSHSSWRTWNTE